jgi:hypothetical protein
LLLFFFLLVFGNQNERQPLHNLQELVIEDALESLVFFFLKQLFIASIDDFVKVIAFESSLLDQ